MVGDCISWFEDGIEFLNYGSPIQELQLAIANSADIKELILNMIREMDLDIEDFRVEKREAGDIQVFTKHNVDGNAYEINLSEESSGTKKLFGLLPFIAESLTKGTTLVKCFEKVFLSKHILKLIKD